MFQNKQRSPYIKNQKHLQGSLSHAPSFASPSHLTTAKGEAVSFLAEFEELVQVQSVPLQSELGSISNLFQV